MDRDSLKKKGRKALKPLVNLLSKVPPNIITIIGFLLVLLSAIIISTGKLRIGALILILGSIFDSLDGEIARKRNKTTSFGAFLDSTLDRYSDFLIFGSIAFAGKDTILTILSISALLGAFITSYARARAEAFNIHVKSGIFTRVERIILIIIGLLCGWDYILYFVAILAAGTNITAIQRIVIVYKKTKKEDLNGR